MERALNSIIQRSRKAPNFAKPSSFKLGMFIPACFIPRTMPTVWKIAFAALVACWLIALGVVAADANDCEGKARREYWRAKAAQAKTPEDAAANWEFASACFEVGEFATNSNERA